MAASPLQEIVRTCGRSLLTPNSTNGSWWMVQIPPTHIRAFGLIPRSAPEDTLMLNLPTFRRIDGAMFRLVPLRASRA